LVLCAVAINNCAAIAAVPPAVSLVSTVATFVSYMATGKGTSDHVISAVSQRDCALHRIVTRGALCSDARSPRQMTAATELLT
jgi:hypothetical protein